MSTLRVNAIQNTSGVEVYTAKAWVNFNGTGTVAIRASGNVSSITDSGVGEYGVNFTNALPDGNYAAMVTPDGIGIANCYAQSSVSRGNLGTVCRIIIISSGNAVLDAPQVNVAIFR